MERADRAWVTALTLLLLAALVAAFVLLLIEAWNGRVRLEPVLLATAASLFLATAAPLLVSRDVYSYAAYGRIFALHGGNPYVRPPAAFEGDAFADVVSGTWLHTRSVYGPLFTIISAAVARMWASSPEATILAFKLLAALGLGVATLFVSRAALAAGNASAGPNAAFASAAVGLNPVLVVHTVGGGHNDALLAGMVAGAVLIATRRRSALAVTALLTLAALIKVVAALPLAIWIWACARRSRRGERISVVAVHALVTVGISAAASAPFVAGWRSVTALVTLAGVEGWASGPRLVARGAQELGMALGGAAAAAAFRSLTYGLFLVAFLVIIRRVLLSVSGGRVGEEWGTGLLALALTAPYLTPWYAAWFAPLLGFVRDPVLVWSGVAVCGVLAMTGVPAEPDGSPGLWEAMLLGVHYAAAPLMLALLGVVAIRILGRRRQPSSAGQAGPREGAGSLESRTS